MQTVIDVLGMVMLALLGVIVILGMTLVIAYECRAILSTRERETTASPFFAHAEVSESERRR